MNEISKDNGTGCLSIPLAYLYTHVTISVFKLSNNLFLVIGLIILYYFSFYMLINIRYFVNLKEVKIGKAFRILGINILIISGVVGLINAYCRIIE